MREIRFLMIGFGNVGRAFARLIEKKRNVLLEDYGLSVRVTGIRTGRHGYAIDPAGLDLQAALTMVENGESLNSLSKKGAYNDVEAFIEACPADVMFENSPVNPENGQPAISYIQTAINGGMHVVTANKGPVVHGYRMLTQLAKENDRVFRFESTVLDGAPIFSLVRNSLPAMHIESLTGILNSTTNLVLTRMEQGETLEEAVAYAQSIGLAEADPANDLDGWDATVKICALVSVLMDYDLKPKDVKRSGIREITPAMIQEAANSNSRWKLICRAERNEEKVEAVVGLQQVDASSPFYNVNNTSSIVKIESDVLPGLALTEVVSGPHTTAYGLLADLLDIYGRES